MQVPHLAWPGHLSFTTVFAEHQLSCMGCHPMDPLSRLGRGAPPPRACQLGLDEAPAQVSLVIKLGSTGGTGRAPEAAGAGAE